MNQLTSAPATSIRREYLIYISYPCQAVPGICILKILPYLLVRVNMPSTASTHFLTSQLALLLLCSLVICSLVLTWFVYRRTVLCVLSSLWLSCDCLWLLRESLEVPSLIHPGVAVTPAYCATKPLLVVFTGSTLLPWLSPWLSPTHPTNEDDNRRPRNHPSQASSPLHQIRPHSTLHPRPQTRQNPRHYSGKGGKGGNTRGCGRCLFQPF